MSATLQKRVPGALVSSTPQPKELNAETVTGIATGFLKRIGNKGGLKPKRVSLEEGTYTVEIEMKKLSAIVQVDSKTHEIKAYEIQSKSEESSSNSGSLKNLLMTFGISALSFLALYSLLKISGF